MSTNSVKTGTADCLERNQVARGPRPTAKVAFFGTFGIQNLGNECTLQAIVHNARKRLGDGQFCAVSYDPSDTLRRHNLTAFPMSHFTRVRPVRVVKVFRILFWRIPGELLDWAKAVKGLRGTDLVVMTGTGMLTDYSTTAFGFPYHVLRWALAARLAGCKLRFVSVGVGPIYEPLSRKFIRWALRLADYRSFRDEFSRNRITKFFDSSGDRVFPDLAFSLPKSIFPERQNRGQQKKQIGVGIMDHRDIHLLTPQEQEVAYSAYLEKMCEFIEWLVKHDFQVRILQGDARHDVAPRAKLRSRLEQRGIRYEEAGIFDDDSSSVEELLNQLAHVDVVISPRFHNLLLGMMMNIPAISLSYDPKNDALLDGVGLGRYRQDLFELDVQALIKQLLELQERTQEIRSMIGGKASEYRRLLDQQYDLIFGDVSVPPGR